MVLRRAKSVDWRFRRYVEGLVSVIGHADRADPLRDYCTGLMMPVARKSVEPMAAITAPGRTAAQHQSLLHFIGQGGWSDEAVLAKVREMVLPRIERHSPIRAWIIDDTSFPKKGQHSVGVAHQYCGQLGKQANCQVAVSLSIGNDAASLPVACRLYLTKDWPRTTRVGARPGCPKRSTSRPNRRSHSSTSDGRVRRAFLARWCWWIASSGHDSKLRAGITKLGKVYAVGIQPQTLVCPPGQATRRRAEEGAPSRIGCDLGEASRAQAAGKSVAHDRVAGRHQ